MKIFRKIILTLIIGTGLVFYFQGSIQRTTVSETFFNNTEENLPSASLPLISSSEVNLEIAFDQFNLLYDKGEFGNAIPVAQEFIEIAQNDFGGEHPHVAFGLNALADAYKAQARYAEAEPLLKQAILISENFFGLDHIQVAFYLHRLGDLYRTQNHYSDSAEAIYKKALKIRENALGSNHEDRYPTVCRDVVMVLSDK
jgi:tetratricopeptide (TPR) repeat protein